MASFAAMLQRAHGCCWLGSIPERKNPWPTDAVVQHQTAHRAARAALTEGFSWAYLKT